MGKSSTRTTYQAAAENELPSIYSHAGVAFRGHMRTNFIGNGGAPVRPVNDRHQPFGFFTTQYKSNPAASENTSMVDTSNPTKPSWDHSVFYWPTKLTDLPATRFFDGACAPALRPCVRASVHPHPCRRHRSAAGSWHAHAPTRG